jgi:hypothetical protein
MGRKKNMSFKLNPEWMLKEPLDFEYNKYTLLDYIQKCEKNLDNFEIYPDFVELSLHLANVQSLAKENVLLLTEKKFQSCDDEIMIKDLFPKKPRVLSEEEKGELHKTLEYSNTKLFDTFNLAKSIWTLAFDNVTISIKKNKGTLLSAMGYIFHYRKKENKVYVWEYQIKKRTKTSTTNRIQINKIYENSPNDITLTSIIENFSKLKKYEHYRTLPIFEMQCEQEFPMEQTIVPIMKRKITSYIYQILGSNKTNNFDSKK